MKKTIETCKTIEKKSYYYRKPKVIDGKCEGYCSSKKPYNLLAVCEKCKFLYRGYEMTADERYAKCRTFEELYREHEIDKYSAKSPEYLNACKKSYRKHRERLRKQKKIYG